MGMNTMIDKTNFPQWLKDAHISDDAEIEIIDGAVHWHGGIWHRGKWLNGILA